MKKARLLLSLSLSLLVLVGSGGFLLSAHYCEGSLKHISIFNEAPSCHEQSTCHHQTERCCSNEVKDAPGCCHNKDLLADADLDYHADGISFDIEYQNQLPTHSFRPVPVIPVACDYVVYGFEPPPEPVGLHILYQVFRC